jgi:membrane protease YdiL (CAAX protease family)
MSADATGYQPRLIISARTMAFSVFLMLGLALAITLIFGTRPLLNVVSAGRTWPVQLASGIAIGLLVTVPGGLLIARVPLFNAFRRQLIELVSRADMSGFKPLWFSLCAGLGEEMLFRAALQPLLGIVLTSVIFTALHAKTGGFKTMNRMKAVYALLVFFISLLLGTVFIQIGLTAAITTHIVIDVIALTHLRTPLRHGT